MLHLWRGIYGKGVLMQDEGICFSFYVNFIFFNMGISNPLPPKNRYMDLPRTSLPDSTTVHILPFLFHLSFFLKYLKKNHAISPLNTSKCISKLRTFLDKRNTLSATSNCYHYRIEFSLIV